MIELVPPGVQIALTPGKETRLAEAVGFGARAAEVGADVAPNVLQDMPYIFEARVDFLVAAKRSFEQTG